MNAVPNRKIDGADIPFAIGTLILVSFVLFKAVLVAENDGAERVTGEQAVIIIILQAFIALSSVVFFGCSSYFRIKEFRSGRGGLLSAVEVIAPVIVSLFLYFWCFR